MNINEIINNIVKSLLNEDYFATKSVPEQYRAKRTEQLVYNYMNSFPPRTSNYIIPYINLRPEQKNILAQIAEANGDILQKIVNGVYYRNAALKTTKELPATPDDFLGEFLTSDTRENAYITQGDEKSTAQFGMALVVGDYLNQYRKNINYKHFISHVCEALKNAYMSCIESQLYNRPDSSLRSDLTLSTKGDSVSHNDAFKYEYDNILQTILNDKSINFSNKEREIFKTFVDICGSGVSPELLNDMADSSEKQQKMIIYQEIEKRTGVSKKQIQNVFSEIQKKLRASKYMNYDWNVNLNVQQPKQATNNIPSTQPKQVTNSIPNPQPKQVTNSIPNPQPTKTQKVLKPAQPKSTKKIDNPNYNGWNYTISESNKNNKNKQNMKKVLVTESVLKSLIIRALNESISENEAELTSSWGNIKKWAIAVRNGANPLHCQEFSDFYLTLHEHPYCENAVKMGFAHESKNQSNVGGNTTLKIDKMFATKPKIVSDIITDFFTGQNCVATDVHTKNGETVVTKPDSFVGDNPINCAKAALRGNESDFFNVLCQQLRIYGAHYCRRHYGELSIQWGVGGQQIGGDKSSAFEDEEGNDMEVFDELGNPINMSDEANRDAYTGKSKEKSDAEFEITSNGDDMYFQKMIKLIGQILNDKTTGLGPQEKAVLQCIIDIAETGVSPERVNQMEGLSDTQKRMVIYDEAAERLGIGVENLKKSISSAIGKARQSKYAKMLEEQKKLKEHFVNEVMKRILNKLF